ncbi:PIR Superfamily Protein [Plasmodium ovale wallikeri]|uniref:PIR Superfamily Protein n=1 Tax=Plasmodium ovale wallikeri TaxID=864142 RepID=A0A1A9APY4_PLAOA|nr:PIR Superfamily Protein [Plasmodium ovale wallikeri]
MKNYMCLNVSGIDTYYSVIKMVDNLGYTIHTRDIPIGVFLDMIKGDIKKLIQTYGHRNCGLRYEDVCKQIQTIITTKKTIISRPMDDHGRGKLNSEWSTKKNVFLKKLFEEEGFINKCIPKKYTNNPSLNELLSKHIDCKRETDLDSICKRSILKHLHDLKWDKMFIIAFSEKYKNYLGKKWGKIIAYTSRYYDNLYIKIENDFMGIIEKYSDFLNSPDFICNTDLDDLSTDDITISTDWQSLMSSVSLEKFTVNGYVKGCYNKNYIDMLKIKASSIQRINNILSSGIAILGFSLIFVFLYRFGPLGSLLRGCTKKNSEVNESINEEVISELYDDSENERSYISYHTVSH